MTTTAHACEPRGADRDERFRQVRAILDRVSDKWTLAVVEHLLTGARRFTELRRGTPGISQRMLTATLRGLERDGLVRRTVYPVVPPRVDYALTPLGEELVARLWPLVDWTINHAQELDKARTDFDTRPDHG